MHGRLITCDAVDDDIDYDAIIINYDYDVAEMSCMSKDGKTMYYDRHLPREIKNNGKWLRPAQALLRHEVPEWREMHKALRELRGDQPFKLITQEMRKNIYLHAHYKCANPSERKWIEDNGFNYDEWQEWCDGYLGHIEHEHTTKPPPDADVRPMSHSAVRKTYPLDLVSALDGWVESDHPRGQPDNAGQFAKTAGGKIKSNEAPPHIAGLKIPPAWTHVRYNDDPTADLLVVGKDAKGRSQYIYSDQFSAKQAAAKFARISELHDKHEEIAKQNAKDRKKPETKEVADCMYLIMQMGVRPGSDEDTGAEKKAYGATTLKAEHVVTDGDQAVALDFIGKKGVHLHLTISDPDLSKMLAERKAKAGADGNLFDTDNTKLLSYAHSLDGGGFKTKDFRTLLGTRLANNEVAAQEPPKSMAEYKKRVLAVAKAVSARLGNTPTVALQSYINPAVFAPWKIAT